jgi:hypothetical protein
MRKLFSFLLAVALIFPPSLVWSATGCTYPGSLDSISDKSTGDFVSVANWNSHSCAIEKLETGPLRPNDGNASAPAYAFRTSSGAGMFLSAANQIDFSTSSTARWRINSSGHLLGVTDNSFDIGATGATRPRDLYLAGKATIGGRLLMATSVVTGADPTDIVLPNNASVRFLQSSGTTSANFSITGASDNNMNFDVPTTTDLYSFGWTAASLLQLFSANGGPVIKFVTEASTDPTAPSANQAILYAKENGSGKTQLCARFTTGSVQCFATEP